MKLELLAPAGDIRSFEAAINSGADAVYLGLGDFNARMKAENFTIENIADVVRKAHFYGVKVYVTINTIIQNKEFKPLFDIVNACVCAKVDAYLVQDLGVAYALKKAFPGIVLHASTQIGVHNLYGAKVAEKIGFSRVVLSRETKLKDIIEIKNNTNLEIEYFVQGALCIAFSGNCYMSSKEQGASGNRGLCKQLCRLPYIAGFEKDDKFEKAGEGYLLSARDLSLANNLKELVDAGVTSFKIEGRLRREGFVAEAVSVYRHVLDDIINGRSGKLNQDDADSLKTAFSRGEYLDRAYLDAGTPFVVEKRFNGHIGRKIGVVKKVSPFKDGLYEVIIETEHQLSNGDGLKFFDKDVEKASLGVGNPKQVGKNQYAFITKTLVKAGNTVNLTLDSNAEKDALEAKRLISINMSVRALVNKPLEIKVSTKIEDAFVECSVSSENVLEKATNVNTGAEEIINQCSKAADSGFKIEHIEVDTDGVFLPKSVVNGIRRNALSGLKDKIIYFYESEIKAIPVKNSEEALNNIVCGKIFDSKLAEQYQKVETEKSSGIIRKGEKVLLSPNDYSASAIERSLKLLDLEGKDVVLQLPIIANSEDIKVIEESLSKNGIRTIVSENLYGLYFVGLGYNVIAGAGHNIANCYAVEIAKKLGAESYCSSIEYDQEKMAVLPRIETANEIPLMTFAHCPFKTIYGNDCSKCTYKSGLILKRERHQYIVRRIRISKCYFQLFPK